MKHPLDFVPDRVRKPLFIALLIWTLGLFAVMQILNRPLITDAAPMGIVSFELAGTPEQAFHIMVSWVKQAPDQPVRAIEILLYTAFDLGFDYLFMPSYAVTLTLGVLLSMGRHKGWFALLGVWVGWGSFIAAVFDAIENFALWKIIFNQISPWPQIAFWCASVKFGLILLGIGFAALGPILPKSK